MGCYAGVGEMAKPSGHMILSSVSISGSTLPDSILAMAVQDAPDFLRVA